MKVSCIQIKAIILTCRTTLRRDALNTTNEKIGTKKALPSI